MEKVSVPLEVLVDRAEDAQIRAEMSKRIIAEWMDCPEHTDTAHSVNTYPFANILRESLWSRILMRYTTMGRPCSSISRAINYH